MQTTPESPKRPRIFYGWYIVAASFTSNMFVAGSYWQGFQVFFLPLIREFGWSRAGLSGAFSMRQAEIGLFAPLLGFIVDRYGPRNVIMASGFVLGLGMILVSFTFSIWSFYLFFMIASIGASGTSHAIGWAVAIARWFKRKRGIALGMGMSGPVMTGLVIFVLAYFVDAYGWRWTLRGTGVLLWMTVIPFAMVIRPSPESQGLLPDGDLPEDLGLDASVDGNDASRQVRSSEQGFSAGEALRSKPFWIASLMFAGMFFGTSAIQVHQVAYFESVGFSTTGAAATVALVFALSGVGRIGGGFLADYIDIRFILVGMVGFHVIAWAYLATAGVTTLWGAVPFTVFFGIPFGAMVSIRPVLLAQLFGTRSLGSLSGMLQATALASGVVGPVLMGWIFDVRGDYSLAINIFIFTTALSLPLAFMVKPSAIAASEVPAKP
jgi:MFS family permease